jgi:hypothetical protein
MVDTWFKCKLTSIGSYGFAWYSRAKKVVFQNFLEWHLQYGCFCNKVSVYVRQYRSKIISWMGCITHPDSFPKRRLLFRLHYYPYVPKNITVFPAAQTPWVCDNSCFSQCAGHHVWKYHYLLYVCRKFPWINSDLYSLTRQLQGQR